MDAQEQPVEPQDNERCYAMLLAWRPLTIEAWLAISARTDG